MSSATITSISSTPTPSGSSDRSSVTPSASLSSSSSPSSSSSSSSSEPPKTHSVKVGAGGFKYEPQELKDVKVGDTVDFEFYPPDHSVARAEFGSPCVPYEYTGKDKVGFWSETQWVNTVNDLTHFQLKINSSEPIFFYCAAPRSCLDHEMVGVINPNSTQTLDAQIKAVKDSSFQVAPGEEIPKEATSTLTNTHGATGTPDPVNINSNSHHGLSGGVIAGIVVGAVAFLVLCAALFFYVGRAKSLKEMMNKRETTASTPMPGDGHSSYGGPSPYPGSPGFPPASIYSANMQQAEYGGQLPPYGQQNVTDQHMSGVFTPMQSPRMSEMKEHNHTVPAELASPPAQQQSFTAELEAPNHAQK
ncbi:unnamed protein product [Periconia digitata]|uniref:Extracellular serine-rich protein n=1 Tax=Periconia digitata TaxID=1303443 RepID=A0A9W4UA33_9PLEO|nr:unnamed protein product [Periconia digitata]